MEENEKVILPEEVKTRAVLEINASTNHLCGIFETDVFCSCGTSPHVGRITVGRILDMLTDKQLDALTRRIENEKAARNTMRATQSMNSIRNFNHGRDSYLTNQRDSDEWERKQYDLQRM